ncbi:MAG: hypothetical protein J7M34_08190 [Anaerolineae bacterium]|nr:hypothetical protein [Anaerolineae bacterium]
MQRRFSPTRKLLFASVVLFVLLILTAVGLPRPDVYPPSATADSDAVPTREGLATSWTFQGWVYEGDVGSE